MEHRAGYTDDLVAQAFANATEPQSAAGALAVVESCTSLIASPLMLASVSGFAISGGMLLAMGRDVLRLGNSVWLIDVSPVGQVQLLRASAFEVSGRSANPARWSYAMDFETPGGETVKRTSPAAGIIHIMGDTPPGRTWRGNAPWASAGLSSAALAEIERGVKEESNLASGRVWTLPDGSSDAQGQSMARTLRALRGGKMVIGETTSQGFGQGKLGAPKADWVPTKTGQDHSLGNVGMRESVQASIASAYGVSPLWFSPRATAPGIREVKRLAFLDVTVPLARAISDQLSLKLDTPVGIGWPNLADQSVDIHLRARGVLSLVQAGVPPRAALVAAGLGEVLLANEDDGDFRIASHQQLQGQLTPGQQPSGQQPHGRQITEPEGRATGLWLTHLRDGKVIKEHDVDASCELCKSRSDMQDDKQINGRTNGLDHGLDDRQKNGRMEYRNS